MRLSLADRIQAAIRVLVGAESRPAGLQVSGMSPTVAVSWGECVDKATILEIKRSRVTSPTARANVERELELLTATLLPLDGNGTVAGLRADLLGVNTSLWEVEDRIREKEAAGDFGEAFVALARQVYQLNDKRAALKRRINETTNSMLVEEKIYAATGA